MGYELDLVARSAPVVRPGDGLEERWRLADVRLAAARDAQRAACRSAPPGDPRRIAAELRLAEARRHWQACALEAAAWESDVETG